MSELERASPSSDASPALAPLPAASVAAATGLRAQLARTFVATLGGMASNPTLLLLALPKAEAFVPGGANGLALLHEFAARPEWPARYLAARLLGERSLDAGVEAQERAWETLLRLADDREKWVTEGVPWSLGKLLRHDPERWGERFLAAFAPEETGADPEIPSRPSASATPPPLSSGARRALLFGIVPALQQGPDVARGVALRVIDAAAEDESGPTRQLGALIVGREVAAHLPEEALALVQRWALSDSTPRQWQAARAMTAPLRSIDPARVAGLIEHLQRSENVRVRNALRGALKDNDEQTLGHEVATGQSGEPADRAAAGELSRDWEEMWQTTAEIPLSERIIDQVIGQDRSVEIVRLAARQKRFVLMVGEPGTGKSMLASAMAEMMGADALEDVLVVPNAESRITPLVEVVPVGDGEAAVRDAKRRRGETESAINYLFWTAMVATSIVAAWYAYATKSATPGLIGGAVGVVLLIARRFFRSPARLTIPKLLVNNARAVEADRAPFVDATGFHAGALLGDVRHDPFQSGGYETAPHELVEAGAIHLAHRGVLFVDEVSTLSIESQQSLLTAIQEKRFPISGRTLGSSGTMIRTAPAPCDFVLILAGNMQDVQKMHPALRSRVRGYGYELYMEVDMPDTEQNRVKLARFCAQEVVKDRRIPHLTRAAVEAVIEEARVRAGRRDRLTTRLRELGGLVRAAGDLAAQEGAPLVDARHVAAAHQNTLSLEEQIRSRGHQPEDGAAPSEARLPSPEPRSGSEPANGAETKRPSGRHVDAA